MKKLKLNKGLWNELSMICYPRLNSCVIKGNIDRDVRNKLEIEKAYRVGLSKRKDVEE
jgi:hypothetical protein